MACMKCGTFGHRCVPTTEMSTAVNKALVPVAAAVNESLPIGAKWEIVCKRHFREHSC